MNFESSEMPSKQEDYTQFYSADPYSVLGVPKGSKAEDIKKARMRLQLKFHPDRNKDPRAEEISKKINIAYDLLHEPNGIFAENPAPQETHQKQSSHKKPEQNQSNKQGSSEQPKQKQYTEPRETRDFKEKKKETPTDVIEKKLFFNLTLGPSYFVKWVSEAKMVGVTSERIDELMKNEEAQKVLKEQFVTKVRIWGGDNPDQCIKYVKEWEKVGVELNAYFKLPEVRRQLIDLAVGINIKIWGRSNPDKFLDFVESWKKVGVDLSKIVESPEVIGYLTDQIIDVKVKIWGSQGPKEFLSFVREWKKAGINLEEVINSSKAQRALTEIAVQSLRYRPDDFKVLVKKWMDAGWKPNQEVMKLYNS